MKPLIIQVGANIKPAVKQLDRFAGKLSRIFLLPTSIRSSLYSIASLSGAVAAIGGLGYAFYRAVQTAAEFEYQMARVKAITTPTTEEFARLAETAKRLGVEMGMGASSVAEGMTFLGQAGFTAEETMDAMEGVLRMATIASLDTASAADYLASIIRMFNKNASEANDVASEMAYVQSKTNTTINQLADSLKYVGPIAANVGWKFEDVIAALGLMANKGLKASLAGTAMRGMMNRLLHPTRQVSEYLKAMNIQLYEADGRLKSLPDILLELKAAGITASEAMWIFGQRAGPGVALLLSYSVDQIKALSKAVEENKDYATKASNTILNTFRKAMGRLTAKVGNVSISAFQSVLPEITKFIDDSVIPQLDKIDKWFKTHEKPIAAAVAQIRQAIETDVQKISDAIGEYWSKHIEPNVMEALTKAHKVADTIVTIGDVIRDTINWIDRMKTSFEITIKAIELSWDRFMQKVEKYRHIFSYIPGMQPLTTLLGEKERNTAFQQLKNAAKWMKGIFSGSDAQKAGAQAAGEYIKGWKQKINQAGMTGTIFYMPGMGPSILPELKKGGEKAAESWTEGFSDTIRDLPNSIEPSLKEATDYLIGHSPPPKGPLSQLDIGGLKAGLAWASNFMKGLQHLPVEQYTRDVAAKIGDLTKQLYGQVMGGRADLFDMSTLYTKASTVGLGQIAMTHGKAVLKAIEETLPAGEQLIKNFYAKMSMGLTDKAIASLNTFVNVSKEKWADLFATAAEYADNFADSFNYRMVEMQLAWEENHQILAQGFMDAIGQIETGLYNVMDTALLTGGSIKEAWNNLFASMARSILASIAKIIAKQVVMAIFGNRLAMLKGKAEAVISKGQVQMAAGVMQAKSASFLAAFMPPGVANAIAAAQANTMRAMALGSVAAGSATMAAAGGMLAGLGGVEKAMAEGGVIDRPTVVLAGEAGPEAFVPLRGGAIPVQIQAPSAGGGLHIDTVIIQLSDTEHYLSDDDNIRDLAEKLTDAVLNRDANLIARKTAGEE